MLDSGTWKYTGIQATEWTQIAIRQDYTINKWDLYIDDQLVLEGLGNAYTVDKFEKFEAHASDTGPMYIDDFSAQAETLYTLLAVAEGPGAVAVDPEQDTYAPGTTITLTATPGLDSEFINWTGDIAQEDSGTNPLIIVINADTNLTANFAAIGQKFTLAATAGDGGDVTIDPVIAEYPENTTVTLTAVAQDGYLFDKWTGDVPTGEEKTNPIVQYCFAVAAEKYEIQLGGACARMGALSGLGKTDIYAAYKGKMDNINMEIESVKDLAKVEKIIPVTVPGLNDERHLVLYSVI